jgi:hypothetical protein
MYFRFRQNGFLRGFCVRTRYMKDSGGARGEALEEIAQREAATAVTGGRRTELPDIMGAPAVIRSQA